MASDRDALQLLQDGRRILNPIQRSPLPGLKDTLKRAPELKTLIGEEWALTFEKAFLESRRARRAFAQAEEALNDFSREEFRRARRDHDYSWHFRRVLLTIVHPRIFRAIEDMLGTYEPGRTTFRPLDRFLRRRMSYIQRLQHLIDFLEIDKAKYEPREAGRRIGCTLRQVAFSWFLHFPPLPKVNAGSQSREFVHALNRVHATRREFQQELANYYVPTARYHAGALEKLLENYYRAISKYEAIRLLKGWRRTSPPDKARRPWSK